MLLLRKSLRGAIWPSGAAVALIPVPCIRPTMALAADSTPGRSSYGGKQTRAQGHGLGHSVIRHFRVKRECNDVIAIEAGIERAKMPERGDQQPGAGQQKSTQGDLQRHQHPAQRLARRGAGRL